MMKKLLIEVGELTDKEYARANEQYPAFASDHEGYAVIEEEVDETREAVAFIREACGRMKQDVRANDSEKVRKVAGGIYEAAEAAAAEAIQVAAMAQKIIESQDIRKTVAWPALPMLKQEERYR